MQTFSHELDSRARGFYLRVNLLGGILGMWLLLVATKKISLCPETPFNQCNLPQDTRAYCLFRLIVNEREMTKLPSADCTPIPIQSIRITPSPLQHSPGACSRGRAYLRPAPTTGAQAPSGHPSARAQGLLAPPDVQASSVRPSAQGC